LLSRVLRISRTTRGLGRVIGDVEEEEEETEVAEKGAEGR